MTSSEASGAAGFWPPGAGGLPPAAGADGLAPGAGAGVAGGAAGPGPGAAARLPGLEPSSLPIAPTFAAGARVESAPAAGRVPASSTRDSSSGGGGYFFNKNRPVKHESAKADFVPFQP